MPAQALGGDLRPIQLARFDLEEYLEGRRSFTREEWIDLLLRTVGLEPMRMEKRLLNTLRRESTRFE